jgi:hypothetical protein
MLWTVFAPPSNMRLDNIPTIKKGHLAIWLDPDLVTRQWSYHVKSRNM